MVKQNTWENTLQSRVWTALTAGNRGQAIVWSGAAAMSRSQADPVLKLLLSLWHHPEHCLGKTPLKTALNSIIYQHTLRCAYLPKRQDLEGFCGGCLAACIWSFSRGRTCGFTTYRALSLPTAQLRDQGHNKPVWNGNEDLHASLQIAWISKGKNKSKWKKTDDVMKMASNIMRKKCFTSKLCDN